MALERRTLHGGRLKAAAYEAREQRLEIDFVDGERRIFKAVPAEVWRRLVAAPNPAVFYADRIEEEYAVERARAGGAPDARSKLDSLFGAGSSTPEVADNAPDDGGNARGMRDGDASRANKGGD